MLHFLGESGSPAVSMPPPEARMECCVPANRETPVTDEDAREGTSDAVGAHEAEKQTAPAKRVEELRRRIREADYAYYALDNPTLSDAQYDDLMRELRALEKAHPDLITPESPTQHVSGEAASGFKKVSHRTAMLSLANVRTPEELE